MGNYTSKREGKFLLIWELTIAFIIITFKLQCGFGCSWDGLKLTILWALQNWLLLSQILANFSQKGCHDSQSARFEIFIYWYPENNAINFGLLVMTCLLLTNNMMPLENRLQYM